MAQSAVGGVHGFGSALASFVGRAQAARFADGAWQAELAGVRDPALVASVVVDGRFRYAMLETLRAYGNGLLAAAGEYEAAAAGLAAYTLRIADLAAVGLRTGPGELAAARLLDAEDAALRQVLARCSANSSTAPRQAVPSPVAPSGRLSISGSAGQRCTQPI